MWSKQYKDEPKESGHLINSEDVRTAIEGAGYYKEGTVSEIEDLGRLATLSTPFAIFAFDGNM